jgi:hypothetical protein
MKVLAWCIDPNDIGKKIYRQIPIPIPIFIKKYKVLIIDTQMVSKKDDTNPILEFYHIK